MAIFHVVGKPNLTILVSNSRVVQVTKNVLCVMFTFWRGFMHVFKDVSYAKNNIVLSFVYQVPNVNFEGMFWTVTNGKYQIIHEHAFNNSQDIILTLRIAALVANITMKDVVMKEEPNLVSHDSKFSILMAKSSFIDLCNYSNEDSPSILDVVVLFYVNSQPNKK
jgi:hypothetical protein